MKIVNGEDAKRIISEYLENFLKTSNAKPVMFYSGDEKVIDNVKHSLIHMFSDRIHYITNEETDQSLNIANGDYTTKDLYVCYNYTDGQFSEKQVEYAYKLAANDNKPLVFFGDKYCFPGDNSFESQFDVYEIQ